MATAAQAREIDTLEVRYAEEALRLDSLGAESNEWFQIPGGLTIDSGAAEHVIPKDMCQNYPTIPSKQQAMGVYYVSANGKELENEGERRLQLTTEDGGRKAMTFQVTEVSKPLGSVYRMCEAGQQVVFNPPGHPDGNYIRNLRTEERVPMTAVNGTYRMSAWVNPYTPDSHPSFPRQGP